jgi:serine/threonine protein kinase
MTNVLRDVDFYSKKIGASSNVCKACPSGFSTDGVGSSSCSKGGLPPSAIAAIVTVVVLLFGALIGTLVWCRRQQTLTHQENEFQMAEMTQLHTRDIQSVLNPLEQSQFDIPSHDLKMQERIGQGGCGFIYKAIMGANTIVAAKEIMSATIDPDDIAEFEHEARMLTQLNHPQVLRVFGFCTKKAKDNEDNQERRYIVTEFAPNGSLESVIEGAIKIAGIIENTGSVALQMPFSKLQALEWAVQVASGMAFLHSKGYVHRDMKPHNVLLNKSKDALVADLGTVRRPPSGLLPNDKVEASTVSSEEKEKYMKEFCQEIDEEQGTAITMSTLHGMTSMKGTPLYMAPEQYQQPDYSYPVDVWAYGVSLVRLFGLKWPYPADIRYTQLVLGIARGQLSPEKLDLADVPDGEVLGVIEDCLRFKAKKRPTMKEVERRLTEILNRCREENGEGETKEVEATEQQKRELKAVLKRHNIGRYYDKLVAEGLVSKEDLVYVTIEDLIGLGMKKFEARKAVAAFSAQ